MRRDADIQVQRISRAIEKVLRSDGWINGIKVYDRRHLRKIAESMARKASEPSRFVNQGFHNTSVTQCLLRQLLETHPAYVMEMIASLVTSGKASVGQGKRGKLVSIDQKSLALDLEARWATDDNTSGSGLRDPVGQLFDLLVAQAHWDEFSSNDLKFVYTQDPKPRTGITGERLVKVYVKGDNSIEVAYEGPNLNVQDTFNLARMFDETPNAVIAHSSVVDSLQEPSITDADQLSSAISGYSNATGRPPMLLVFAGLLPGGSGSSRGYDLHAVTALNFDDTYFLESRWGQSVDLALNGLSGEELISAMRLPERTSEGDEDYHDSAPPYMRTIDPAYPVPRYARAPQILAMQKEHDQIAGLEKNAQSNPAVQAQEKYFEELEKWEARRAEHQAIFGDDLPFTVPAPAPPSTQPS
ncbi:hypothetical protein KF728_08980 [Candidatus Obscuribacterales bacterium]|nr:hypothetical protein [Candidatus Obscuribacterales bacterium]